MSQSALHRQVQRPASAPTLFKIAFWVCIVIGIAVVIRRMLALAAPNPNGPPNLVALDHVFQTHAALTLAHIIPALAFVLIAPVAMFRRARWSEIALLILGPIVGLTAYAMSIYSVGGRIEQAAVLFFNTLFLYSLYRAFREAMQSDARRRWLVRATIVLLGIATTRPVMGIFFATSRLTHLTLQQFFGIAFWIGFSINWIVVELWLHSRRRRHADFTL